MVIRCLLFCRFFDEFPVFEAGFGVFEAEGVDDKVHSGRLAVGHHVAVEFHALSGWLFDCYIEASLAELLEIWHRSRHGVLVLARVPCVLDEREGNARTGTISPVSGWWLRKRMVCFSLLSGFPDRFPVLDDAVVAAGIGIDFDV